MSTPHRKDHKMSRQTSETRRLLSAELDYLHEGFVGRSEAKVPFFRLHFHDDIEVSVNKRYPVVAMFGGRQITLPPDHLVVFWAAQPHGPIETTEGGWAYGVHIPLPWVLQWRLPSALIRRLLAGEVLLDPPGNRPVADLDLVENWAHLLQLNLKEFRSVVLLEAEARMRRLAIDLATRTPQDHQSGKPLQSSRGPLRRFEQMATLIAAHYCEPLTIEDIAKAVHIKPAYAMRLFRKICGMTIHEFLEQHRIIHAQRLLATTDGKIDDIAAHSGFGSPAAFYACFRKLINQTPAAYRQSFQENDSL